MSLLSMFVRSSQCTRFLWRVISTKCTVFYLINDLRLGKEVNNKHKAAEPL